MVIKWNSVYPRPWAMLHGIQCSGDCQATRKKAQAMPAVPAGTTPGPPPGMPPLHPGVPIESANASASRPRTPPRPGGLSVSSRQPPTPLVSVYIGTRSSARRDRGDGSMEDRGGGRDGQDSLDSQIVSSTYGDEKFVSRETPACSRQSKNRRSKIKNCGPCPR